MATKLPSQKKVMLYIRRILIFFVLTILTSYSLCAQKITISGYVSDSESGEKLIGANISTLNSTLGTTTNEYGFYSFTLQETQSLIISYIGYQTDTLIIGQIEDKTIDISLSPAVNLEVVEVQASRTEQAHRITQMSQTNILVKDIKALPAILGEVDVIKVLQLMPGIQSGNEGLSGLYVRGGSPDQNLVLLDGVPIYNPSHVLGIFSVFNADAIKNVSLTKGGFPARYGGRLSSVLNVNMKEGNLNSLKAEGAISTIASKLTLEGPINKGKTSFLVSARRTYVDQLIKPILKSQNEDLDDIATYFYDLNAKIQHRINDKHAVYLSAYTGTDKFRTKTSNSTNAEIRGGELSWQNQIGALRWNYKLNNKTFINTTLSYTNYDIDISSSFENENQKLESSYISGIRDYAVRSELEFIPSPQHYLRIGGSFINHTYSPGALTLNRQTTNENIDSLIGIQQIKSAEYNIFAEDEWNITDRLSANIGLHFSGFAVEQEHYTSLQPRINIRYQLASNLAIKSSFASMAQYINLLSSETLGLPSDLWVPSTARIKPQIAWQAAGGIAWSINDQLNLTTEGFYKKMNNVISYTEGAQFVPDVTTDWQDNVVQGQGEVYGLEVFLNKNRGRTTGWLGYTLSWNWRQFDAINAGMRYPFRYDRRHDASVVVSHKHSDKVSYSFSWVYGTGNAITVPTARYATRPDYQDNTPTIFQLSNPERFVTTTKNNFRMSATHRLDASIVFHKKKKRFERNWIISIYNVYSHVNPYFVVLEDESRIGEGGSFERFSVLKEKGILPIIPSVSYTFKF